MAFLPGRVSWKASRCGVLLLAVLIPELGGGHARRGRDRYLAPSRLWHDPGALTVVNCPNRGVPARACRLARAAQPRRIRTSDTGCGQAGDGATSVEKPNEKQSRWHDSMPPSLSARPALFTRRVSFQSRPPDDHGETRSPSWMVQCGPAIDSFSVPHGPPPVLASMTTSSPAKVRIGRYHSDIFSAERPM